MLHRIERVPELNRCSAKAIAVWSMLHHALDRRGRVVLGGVDFRALLVRRLAIPTPERQWFHAALRELEAAGLFRIEGDVLELVGHYSAEEERASKSRGRRGAPRELRATSAEPSPDLSSSSSGPSADLPPTSSDSSPDLPSTFSEPPPDLRPGSAGNDSEHDPPIREEKRREEEKTQHHHSTGGVVVEEEPRRFDAALGVPPPAEVLPGPSEVRDVLRRFEEPWADAHGAALGLVASRETQRAIEVLRWATRERPDAPFKAIRDAATAAVRSGKLAGLANPWAVFAAAPGRWLAARPGPSRATSGALCVQVFRERWERAHPGQSWEGPRLGKGDAPEVIDAWAEQAARELGCSPKEVIVASIRRWSRPRDAERAVWLKEHGYPWRSWALSYAEELRAEDIERADAGLAVEAVS